MKTARHKQAPRGIISGIAGGLFLLLPMFLVLLFETWLHLTVLANDYRTSQISAQIQRIKTEREDLRVREADRESIAIINAKAPDLGLQTPQPGQIEVVRVRSGHSELSSELASLSPITVGTLPGDEPLFR